MKTLLVFLLSIIIFKNSYSQSEWKWISPNPPLGWAYSSVLTEGKAYFWCQYNCVIKLDIATEKFEMLPTYAPYEHLGLGEYSKQGIAFVDSLNGFITDVRLGDLKTTDGGYSWTNTSVNSASSHMIAFGNKQIGWKLTGNSLYRTSDVGNTWTYLSGPTGGWGSGIIMKTYPLDQNRLWLLRSTDYNVSGPDIWYSSNSGFNWTSLNTGLHSDSMNQISYYDIKMNSSGVGYIIGSVFKKTSYSFDGLILKTTDGGVTWTFQQFPNERYVNILWLNDYDLVVLGNQGYYSDSQVIQRKSTDSGISWSLYYPLSWMIGFSNVDNAIYSASTDVIYLIGTRGFYKSVNKGISYEKVSSETDVMVSNVAFDSRPLNPDKQMGLAYTEDTTWPFLITVDGGYHWTKRPFPNSLLGPLYLVGISEEVIYIIVDQTQLYKSIDQGNTWEYLSLPMYSGLQGLSVYSKNDLSLHAYKNMVTTTDGGDSWILGPTIENVWWKSTDIASPGIIIGTGTFYDSSTTKGFIYSSSDYGLSWHITDTDYENKKVIMTDDKVGYILSGRKIYKTLDSGISWKVNLAANSNEGFYQGSFLDSINGFISTGYSFKKTTNGGRVWTNQIYDIPLPGIQNMEYNAKGDLFITGGGSMIMLPGAQSFSPEINNPLNESVSEYYLSSSFPNPFNSSSTIKYYIPSTSQVIIKVFNMLGEEIETLVDEVKPSGTYQVTWNAKDLTSGVYFYRLQAGDFVQTRKMILLK